MRVGDIEDFALGFVQDNVKLFALGYRFLMPLHIITVDEKEKVSKTMQKLLDKKKKLADTKKKEIQKADLDPKAIKKIDKKFKEEEDEIDDLISKENSGPILIKFPQLTRPIVSVAVGF